MTELSGCSILAVHPSSDLYGSDRVFLDAVRALQGSGAAVEVVLPGEGRLEEALRQESVTVHVMDFPVLRRSLLSPGPLAALAARSWPTTGRLARRIRSMGPDVVYVNTVTVPHWVVGARRAGVRTVCHVHELDSQLPALVGSVLLSPLLLADRLIVNSDATRQYVERRLPSTRSRISLVYNGFRMGEPPAPAGFRSTWRLTLVGRLSPRKGQDVAIEAVSMLTQRGHDVVLELVGDTFDGYEWFEQSLRAQVARLGLGPRVLFSGFQADPSAAYAGADVVIVPSTLESFGNVAVEGLAAGRPVVASAVGGLPEIVHHEVSGLLVPPRDARALADAVGKLLADPVKAARMGADGARTVRQRFAQDRFEQELSRAVAGVCGPAAANAGRLPGLLGSLKFRTS